MPTPRPKIPALAAAGLLANPLVQWGVGLVMLCTAVWVVLWFLENFYEKSKAGAKGLFTDLRDGVNGLIDSTLDNVASIVGRPESQNLDERTRTDQVKGLIVEGDRALSDAIDSPWLYLKDLVRGPSN